jgi:hypothetical protein
MKNLSSPARDLLAGCLYVQQKMVEELLVEMDRLVYVIMNKNHPNVDDWSRMCVMKAVRRKDHIFISREERDRDVLALRDVVALYEYSKAFLQSDHNILHKLQEQSNEPKAWYER